MVRLSYSKITDFEVCPRKYYYSYVEKVPFVANEYLIKGREIHEILYTSTLYPENMMGWVLTHPKYKDYQEMMDNYIKLLMSIEEAGGNLVPRNAEIKFYDDVFDFSGIVDRIDEHNGAVLLTDYKSDARVSRTKHDRQLLIYSYFIERVFKIKATHMGAFFLKHDKTIKAKPIKKEEQEEAIKWLYRHKKDIESRGEDIEKFEAKPQVLCRYCSHASTGICAEGKKYLEQGAAAVPIVEMDEEMLLE